MTAIDLGAGFTITACECDGYVYWKVTGSLDMFRSPRLSEVIAAACEGGRSRHLLDLSAVSSLDACAVRVLVTLHKLVRPEGRLAVTAAPRSEVWSVLNATGAARILQLVEESTEAAAVLAAAAERVRS